jgi:ATP-dependent helicase/nuclease subunit A
MINAPFAPQQPPDQAERETILNELDTTMLVEASAGSGKTASMVGRMVALVREGKCSVETLAAITFTRKSAAELRARFQVALEKAVREAAGPARVRLTDAADHAQRCYIGTIHAFCARLLRERPVEAGVSLSFEELDEATDARLRTSAWQRHVDGLIAAGDPILAELEELGLEIGSLGGCFVRFATYPDVEQWPAPAAELPPLAPVVEALRRYAAEIESLLPTLPDDSGNDKLMPKYRRLVRMLRQANLDRLAELLEILAEFTPVTVVQKLWPGKKAQALAELQRWDDFAAKYAMPLVEAWRHKRYPVVLRVLQGAVAEYDRLRRESGGLNYQDLLLTAAKLLRDNAAVRRYFRRRFSHLLVDEFQDTDPIQAEVMLLLSADDPQQNQWRQCRPVPGALFVVGDPKQSIYRFRRADIVTYNEVKRIIQQCGKVIVLWSNFRSHRPVVQWVNQTFDTFFPTAADAYAPERRPMEAARSTEPDGPTAGVSVLVVPAAIGKQDAVVQHEAERIARLIHAAIHAPPPGESAACPGDFLIVTVRKRHLSLYAEKLAQLGIPSQVTGGTVLNEVPELALACLCLEALVQPEDPVALVALLRSPLFGISDPALYAFKRAGGRFSYSMRQPEALAQAGEGLAEVFSRLEQYARWLRQLPPVAALERMLADLGLAAAAAAHEAGNVHAGSLCRAVELIRSAQREVFSAEELAAYLRQLVSEEESHDGLPALPAGAEPVRIMNLHQVKGLEAPIVLLADPTGWAEHEVSLHVDRSGQTVCGHLALYGATAGRGAPPLLACPRDWDTLAAEEKKFIDAEHKRLFYVAATRAGRRLIVTLREKGGKGNPWEVFAEHLGGCGPVPEPDMKPVPTVAGTAIGPTEPAEAAAAIQSRWQSALRRTYATAAAKQIALASTRLAPAAGEHGTEWGTVIHTLLETAMSQPHADLTALAHAALSAQALPGERGAEAVAVVQAVRKSQIWRRAMVSQRRLVEVPFQLLQPSAADALPTLVRGVIDLAFYEAGGWVIVDYKTDVRPLGMLPALVDHYRPQVEMYADAWLQTVGEPVREAGLYFSYLDRYVAVGRE